MLTNAEFPVITELKLYPIYLSRSIIARIGVPEFAGNSICVATSAAEILRPITFCGTTVLPFTQK
jgi:hypothetical protein